MLFPPPGATDRNGPDVDTLFAIARVVLKRIEAGRRREQMRGKFTDDAMNSVADYAYDAIVWSDDTMAFMSEDRERFTVPAGLKLDAIAEAWHNPDDPLNQIGDRRAFELGFDVAVRLTARIFADPLASHDVGDIFETAQRYYVEFIEEQRREYFAHQWPDRLASAEVATTGSPA